jgi:transposase-like protein
MASASTTNFEWTEERTRAAMMLAGGATQKEVAAEIGYSDRQVRTWVNDFPQFAEEVDRLTLMLDLSSRAERVRIAKRLAKQRVNEEGIPVSNKDLLDILKFIQSETNGAIHTIPELTAFLENAALMAGPGQGSASESNSDAPAVEEPGGVQ